MPPRSPFPIFTSSSDSRVALLQGLLIGAIVITGLYVAREVLLPLVIAILLGFVLTPLLLLLRRIKVSRGLAVMIVVTFAFSIIFALGWMLSQQATELAENLPAISTRSPTRSAGCANRQNPRRPSTRRPVPSRVGEGACRFRRYARHRRGTKPHLGGQGTDPADPRRDQGVRAAAIRDLAECRRHRAAAARYRRHRRALRHFHPAAARGSARPSDPPDGRVRHTARHRHDE